MIKRWLIYLVSLLGGMVFYYANSSWISDVSLKALVLLPLAALVMSLPAMILARFHPECGKLLRRGAVEALELKVNCWLPAPLFRCRFEVTRPLTGESWILSPGDPLPAQHCGRLICRIKKLKIYDYLGLFGAAARNLPQIQTTVWPEPVALEEIPEPGDRIALAWKPKPGGGFSEHHELRLYRPGDNLRQIHWKLSAKTGKHIIREAMEPVRSRVIVYMTLRGTAAELDQYFGQLLWLSGELLEKDIPHEIRALTGTGTRCLPVQDQAQLQRAVEILLGCTPAGESDKMEEVDAAWQYRIGGGAREG